MPIRPLVLALTAVLPALLLAGCAGATAPGGGDDGTKAASSASAEPAKGDSGSVDVCTLVPTAELKAVVGADPGAGVPAKGKIAGGQCTWDITDTHSAVAQYSTQADLYLPDSVWKRPKDGVKVKGADRGFAARSTHTVLVVKGGKGLLFTDIAFGTKDKATQDDYDALAQAILAKL